MRLWLSKSLHRLAFHIASLSYRINGERMQEMTTSTAWKDAGKGHQYIGPKAGT